MAASAAEAGSSQSRPVRAVARRRHSGVPSTVPGSRRCDRTMGACHWRRIARCLSSARSPTVKRYKNLSRDSGVVAYELSAGSIVVQFKDGWKYEYTNHSAGAAAVATMHRLALGGRGLSTFISTNVRK